MAFQCLLVSDDPSVLSTMDPILHDLSISTNICRNPLRTGSWPVEAGADLFVIDMEAMGSAELLRHLCGIYLMHPNNVHKHTKVILRDRPH